MTETAVAVVIAILATGYAQAAETLSVVATPVDAPPSDAIVLFDGTSAEHWLNKRGGPCDWPVVDGALVSQRNGARSRHIVSKLHFRDAQIHMEFLVPDDGKSGGGAGNSGVYIHGLFELQILNSYQNRVRPHEAVGAVYGISPPLVNAARPIGQWQVYDITYIAPRRGPDGEVTKAGSITANLNGVLVQHNVPVTESVSRFHPYRYQTTPYLKTVLESLETAEAGPVFLQDHDSPVRFRTIWIRPLDNKARQGITRVPASR